MRMILTDESDDGDYDVLHLSFSKTNNYSLCTIL